jgi:hypothetical protein
VTRWAAAKASLAGGGSMAILSVNAPELCPYPAPTAILSGSPAAARTTIDRPGPAGQLGPSSAYGERVTSEVSEPPA